MNDGARHARELAGFATALEYQDIPQDAREHAVLLILDTFGVILSGSTRPELKRLREQLPHGGEAQVISPELPRTSSAGAAFANATAGSFLELDQGERPTGHPALHGLPPLLAHAQARHLSGREFLTAFIVHYEIQARVQRAFALRWPIHPHGTFGTPAAAAALGKLDGGDAEQLFNLICAGATLTTATSWSSCLQGATIRNAYAGLTAQTAFLVHALVSSGFTSSEDALSETFGKLIGEEQDIAALSRDLGRRFAVTGGYIKFHAACALTHPALDAVLDAVGAITDPGVFPPFQLARTFTPSEVSSVHVLTTERAARLSSTVVSNELAAKFSIPAAIATLLVHANSGPAAFCDAALEADGVREIAARVVVAADDKFTRAWPAEFNATVEIELSDGTRLEGACVNPYGSSANPAALREIRAKFEALVGTALAPEQASVAWEAGLALAESKDCDLLLDACFSAGKSR